MSISVIQGVLRIPAAQEKIRQKGIEKPSLSIFPAKARRPNV